MRRSGASDWTGLVAALVLSAAFLLGGAHVVRAQDLGHRIPGSVGLDAGQLLKPGLFAANRTLYYTASRFRDRHGDRAPIPGFRVDIVSDLIGAALVLHLEPLHTYLQVTAALSLVRIEVDRGEGDVVSSGLGDLFLEPLKLGWRGKRGHLITSYGVYLPSGRFQLGRSGVSTGHVTHQLSFGGQAISSAREPLFLAGILSYDTNGQKLGLDVTRGDLIQFQGGAGARAANGLELGLVGYALWQVRDDSGSDVPEVLRGVRDRVFGLGYEVGATFLELGLRLRLRYERDLYARARPEGAVLAFNIDFLIARPRR